ncbi:MAG: murein biosynthesis integral membrane protein MurJ, partial [Bradyrhizobium sp.]|uniref:murein biosynthesis integral membrane protein MurJ n=1 Tax=Bradyrhizobium sp. TaxID=376 RepID=UPI0011FCB64D
MIRSFLTVSAGTLASRLLGFLRDAMIAALLGAGGVADAFLVAFQLVNVVRRLLTEGALNAALVPAWLRVRETEGPAAAAAFAGRVLGTVSATLILAAAVIGLLMPLVIAALAPGFAGHDTLRLAVDDARLMLPYLAFAGPATVMMALLNAQARFALTAFAPLLFNIALISVMIGLVFLEKDAADAALVIAATVGIAGLVQLLMLVLRPGGNRIATPLRVGFDSQMRGFFAKAVPGMIASAGPQWLVVGGAILASSSPSAVSWLYFANRLIELPLGLVGVAMGTVLVPELTRALRLGDRKAMMHAESRGLELAVGLALPATLGLIALSAPVVRMLFEHGAFTATDAAATAQALMWLALGLPAHVLVKALSPAFFARDDTTTPLLATVTGVAVAVVLALVLSRWFGASGIAASIAMGAWSSALALIRRGAVTFGFSIDTAARRRLPRIVAAALAMGGLLWLAAPFVLGPG